MINLASAAYKKVFAEVLGTFALVFFGCGSIMISVQFPQNLPPPMVPIVFGLVIACMVYAVGHISGAHFNPAVTLGFAVARHFPMQEVLLYWIAQGLGAILASSLLNYLLPQSTIAGATIPAVMPFQAVIWEAVLTFFLMFVIMAVATDTRAVGTMAGIAIGGTVALAAFVGGPVTGASMNPARSLGPAIFQGTLPDMWIYIVGPLFGAVVGALTYGWIRCEENSEKSHAQGCC